MVVVCGHHKLRAKVVLEYSRTLIQCESNLETFLETSLDIARVENIWSYMDCVKISGV